MDENEVHAAPEGAAPEGEETDAPVEVPAEGGDAVVAPEAEEAA